MSKYLPYLYGFIAGCLLGYWQGCLSNECERPHIVEQSTAVKRTVEEQPDSTKATAVIKDGGTTKAKATTDSEGRKHFTRTLQTDNTNLTLESTYDPKTDVIEDRISFVAIREITVYWTRKFEQIEYATNTVVERVVKDPWYEDPLFVVAGAVIGFLLSLFI